VNHTEETKWHQIFFSRCKPLA